jgi:hypothetical protein
MLFGRFLVERGLLIHPDLGEPIDPKELPDLARDEGLSDPWALVERFAAPSLPAVFKPDDPVLAMTLDPALARRLRDLVAALPDEVFTADDSLGWTYQFWRTAEKGAVNKTGGKIGAAELPAVTQLFTEPYMVKFLLHNTLGGWWAGKVLAADPTLARNAVDEQSLRDTCALAGVSWDFLRFVRDRQDGPWRPAAGTFPGWPSRAAEITYCDPCCGSGHFLVEAFAILAALRQHEEGSTSEDAAHAVLRDNLHGLELDGRCVQIAAFNVALTAWTMIGGPVALPQPHIAWVGAPPPLSRSEMAALANGDAALRGALVSLHDQFAQAPLLGSLLEVGAVDLLDVDLRERGEAALAKVRGSEPERAEGAVAARGLLDAANLLASKYVLQATNVPFLGKSKVVPELSQILSRRFAKGKADLATAMLIRMESLAEPRGSIATVSKQEWCFLSTYALFRKSILKSQTLNFVVALGEEAWESFGKRGPLATLSATTNSEPAPEASHFVMDTTDTEDRDEKISRIATDQPILTLQEDQVANPDSRVTTRGVSRGVLLSSYADAYQGIKTEDDGAHRRYFWEFSLTAEPWRLYATTVDQTCFHGGLHHVLRWGQDGEHLARKQGLSALGRRGVAVSQMRHMPVTTYMGVTFDSNVSPIVPRDPAHIMALWAFCSSPDYKAAIRRIDTKRGVTNATLVKVPFDLASPSYSRL